jgi:hypothetical protein
MTVAPPSHRVSTHTHAECNGLKLGAHFPSGPAMFSRNARLWLLVPLLACSGMKEPDRSRPVHYDGRGFSATLRMDVSSNAVTPTPGVTLYDFHVGSRALLFMYVGDRPGYPHFSWAPEQATDLQLPSGLTAHCRSAQGDRGTARECLIDLAQISPRKLHVWYDELEPKWARAADVIIESIKPRAL